MGAYLAEAFPPGSEREKDGSLVSPVPAARVSVPPGPRTSLPPGRYNSSAPPPRRSSSPPAEQSTDLDGLALAAAGAPSEENEFEAEDTMVGQSQAPTADSRRPSLGPPRPSTGVYLHVGVTTEDVKKKP